MAITNADGIVTPDEGTTLNPVTYLAAMADSIKNGIGVRLARQEQAIGLKAGIPVGTTVPFTSDIIAPYEILGSGECFTHGLELEGGVATVSVEGMYFISAAASLESTAVESSNDGRTIALQIYRNTTQLAGCEVGSATHWATGQANCVINCVPGDTLYVKWYSAGPVAGEGTGILSDNTPMNSLSIVLVTPVTPTI